MGVSRCVKLASTASFVDWDECGACVQIVARRTSFLSGAVDTEHNVDIVVKVGNAMTCTALAVPVILLSLSDTGLLFSLVGAALSAFEGFQKGVGSVK